MTAYTYIAPGSLLSENKSTFVDQLISNLNQLEEMAGMEATQLWCKQSHPGYRAFSWITLGGWEIVERIDEVRAAFSLSAFEWPSLFNLYSESRFASVDDLNTLSRAVGYPATRQNVEGNRQNYYLFLLPVFQPNPYYSGYKYFGYKLSDLGTYTLDSEQVVLTAHDPYEDPGFLPPDLHKVETINAEETFTRLTCFLHAFKDSLGYIKGQAKTDLYIVMNSVPDVNERELLLRGLWPNPESYQSVDRGVLSMEGVEGMAVDKRIAIPKSVIPYQPSPTGFYSNGTEPRLYSADTVETQPYGNLVGGMMVPYTWNDDENITAEAYGPQMAILTTAQASISKSWTVKANALCNSYLTDYQISSIDSAEVTPPALHCRIERSTSDYDDLPGTVVNGPRGWVMSYDGSFSSASIGFYPDPAWSEQPQLNSTPPFQLNSFVLDRVSTPSGIPGVDNTSYNEISIGQGYQRDAVYAQWSADLPLVWLAARR